MATINNFDQSSSGINMELHIYRDEDAARNEFLETFNSVLNPPHKKFEFYSVNFVDGACFNFIDPEQYSFTREDLNKAIRTQEGLIEDLINHLGGSPFTSRFTKKELIDGLQEVMPPSDLAGFMLDNFKPLFEMIECVGYSQGDYVTVVYSKKEVAHATAESGKPWAETMPALRSWLSRRIYDQPVCGEFIVNLGSKGDSDEEDEKTYYMDLLLVDPYEYSKDQILAAYAQQGDEAEHVAAEAYKFLSANLPDFI